MINLDEEDVILAINDLINRDSGRGLRKLVKLEHKTDKIEFKIICICDYKIFIISLNKNNKPHKVEWLIHFLEVKKVESGSTNQLNIYTDDNKEYKIYSIESEQSTHEFCHVDNTIDDILACFFANYNDAFPSVSIKDLIDVVQIEPEKRLHNIINEIDEMKSFKKKIILCDNYSKAYRIFCNFYSVNYYQEVVWDVDNIFGKNSITEFSLNDFDYVNLKDYFPLISSLRHNKWFDGVYSEDIKLTNEMQEELIKVLTFRNCNIKNVSLIHSNLKFDFFNKMQTYLSNGKKNNRHFLSNLNAINLSRNSIEDRGFNLFINLCKEHTSHMSNLKKIILSKCSLSSKSVNFLFASINLTTLTHLDLSHNHLSVEPTELFKFLSESNKLVELNLSSSDIDVDKLLTCLSKGGCDVHLRKLMLNNNHSFSKISNNEHFVKFLSNTKCLSHLELSNCKLNGNIVQTLLSSLKSNSNMAINASTPISNNEKAKNGLSLNLSSNDLGSCIRQFMYELANNHSIAHLDLGDNNLDNDSDHLFALMPSTSIKSLSLSRNFTNSKTKLVLRVIHSLTKWLMDRTSTLEYLWLMDCKLKSSLNDLISELGEFNRLRLLDISGNDIGDFGVNLLSKSLQVNRSLETLIFDRSNVTFSAYSHITESLKRNYTLKSIQMPINDICVLYQKSPDRVVDIFKQMTEILNERTSLLNIENKLDLDQLFKTKMKLIDDCLPGNTVTGACSNSSIGTLNTSVTSISSNSVLHSSPAQYANSNLEFIDSGDLDESAPNSLKQILIQLNECANNYMNENSIDKNFSKYNSDIKDQLDDYLFKLERDLLSVLKKKYPKYTFNQSNNQIRDDYEFNKIKNNINNYMDSMLVQMHNDICEMTYKMSLTMAEKIMNEYQSKNQSTTSVSAPVASSTATAASNKQIGENLATTVESFGKKLIGGIKLPFANLGSSSSTHQHAQPTSSSQASSTDSHLVDSNPQSVQKRMELNSKSKSKRPISSQMYELNANSNATSEQSTSLNATPAYAHSPPDDEKPKNARASTSSNENIIEIISDDEILISKKKHTEESGDSRTSSREKTPDGDGETPKFGAGKTPAKNLANTSDTVKKESNNVELSASGAPIPAPRKAKSIVKSFFGSLGVNVSSTSSPTSSNAPISTPVSTNNRSASQSSASTSPKMTRKIDTISEEIKDAAASVVETEKKSPTSTNEEVKQLQHLNKDRPKRANVKRPTLKNPQSIIEVEVASENLESEEKPAELTKAKNNNAEKQDDPPPTKPQQLSVDTNVAKNDDAKPKQISPSNNPLSKIKQPEISLNVLENVKLRKTIKVKATPDENSSSSSSNSNAVTNQTNNPSSANANPTPSTNGSTSTSTTSATATATATANSTNPPAPNKLANRFSMFEQSNQPQQQANPFINVKLKKTTVENAELSEHPSETEVGAENKQQSSAPVPFSASLKPTPPLPPNKPPRPFFNPASVNSNSSSSSASSSSFVQHDAPNSGNILVKLRPVSTLNTNNNNTNNTIANENNSSSILSEKIVVKGNNSENSTSESDKRSSVKEIVQMLSDESKA